MEGNKTVLVLLKDLMFQVKIADAARRLDRKVLFSDSAEKITETASEMGTALILVDVNYSAADPIAAIRRWKAKPETKNIPLIGYVSHVQVELRQAAVEAGCDVVLARSAFVSKLPELLEQYR